MVSTKFYSDYDEMDVFTSTWAKEGQVDIERLKQLEILFLNAIQWKVIVTEKEFYEKLKTVERLLAMKEGLSRGWFTYSELEKLMPPLEIAKQIINYTTILMFSFACSIATLALSSVILASIPVTTDLAATQSNSTQTSLLPESLMPKNHEPSGENFFDEAMLEAIDLNLNPTCNFSLDFPVLMAGTSWDIKQNQQDVTNFQIMPHKHDPVPLWW